jgi:hypothetical protein
MKVVTWISSGGLTMHLRQWLFDNKVSQISLSREIGFRHTYISNCVTGLCKPGKKFQEAVKKFTSGKVTEKDWPKEKPINPDEMDFFESVRDEKGKFIRKKS